MDIAIIGFVGVIVGAIITAFPSYLHHRADRRRDSRNRAIEIKRASRLIDADLSRAQAAAEICVYKRHWWSTDVQPLTLGGWQQYRAIIAPELSDKAWQAVRVAIEAVDNLKTGRNIAIEDGLILTTIDDTTAEKILPMLNDIKAGRSALAPFTLDQPA